MTPTVIRIIAILRPTKLFLYNSAAWTANKFRTAKHSWILWNLFLNGRTAACKHSKPPSKTEITIKLISSLIAGKAKTITLINNNRPVQ